MSDMSASNVIPAADHSCPRCGGKGFIVINEDIEGCPACHGSGKLFSKPAPPPTTDKPTHDEVVAEVNAQVSLCPGCDGTGKARPGVTQGAGGECIDCLPYRDSLGPGRVPVTDRRDFTRRYRHERITAILDPGRTLPAFTPLSLPAIISRTLSHPRQPVYSPEVQRRLAQIGPYTRAALDYLNPSPEQIEHWLYKHDEVARLRIEAKLKRRRDKEIQELRIFLACGAILLLMFIMVGVIAIHQLTTH